MNDLDNGLLPDYTEPFTWICVDLLSVRVWNLHRKAILLEMLNI